jgi:hypothetical protein
VLGAGETIKVEEVNSNGEVKKREYRLRPVVAQNLCDLEQDSLEHCKRQYLKTYSQNADLLGDRAKELIEQKFEEVASWNLSNLPQKDVFDVSNVPIKNKKIKWWLIEHHGEAPEDASSIRSLLSTALDNGQLKPEQLKKMTGVGPIRGRVRYDQWWITASMEGMVSFITASIKLDHPEVTKEQVAKWSFVSIADAARKVEKITVAALGNM